MLVTVSLPVDYVNIGEHASSASTAVQFWQVRHLHTLHMDSSHTGCAFRSNVGAVPTEDNFGFKQAVRGKSRCTLHNYGATQWCLFDDYMAD